MTIAPTKNESTKETATPNMPPLNDATQWFKAPALNWSLRGRAFAGQLPTHIVRGLYVHIDENTSPLPVFDRNRCGRQIIFGSTTALKVGKFVNGLSSRMLQNYDHFHRRPALGGTEDGIFPSVLTFLYVLDLSAFAKEAIRPLETIWNRSIRAELKARQLLHPEHRGRSESINLAHSITTSEVKAIVEPIAAQLVGTSN